MIEFQNVTKKYGSVVAVEKLSFTLESGRIYGFLGPNGAGKSTTMNMMTGCLSATSGEIRINGHDIYEEAPQAKRSVGYLPEIPPVYPDMTPAEYLRFVGQAKGLRGNALNEDVGRVMRDTELTAVRDRLILNLSKGYRQRVGIAQALLGDPEIVILDEPTVGLDPRQIREIRDLIRRMGENRTVILSSHILPEIAAVCDHVLILSHGRLVANAAMDDLSADLTGHVTTEILFRGEENPVKMALNDLAGVISYEIAPGAEAGTLTVELQSEPQTDLRDALFSVFCQLGYPIYSLTNRTVTLEDVFLRLTSDGAQSHMKNGLQWSEYDEPLSPDTEQDGEADESDASANGGYTALFSDRNGGDGE